MGDDDASHLECGERSDGRGLCGVVNGTRGLIHNEEAGIEHQGAL